MLGELFNSTTIPVLEQVVNFSQTRHELLAGNIANIDTPGYRLRDLSPSAFQSRLRDAIESREQRVERGIAESASGGDPFREARDEHREILYHDLSDGSLETQITEITKNQMQHNLALSLMTHQFRLLHAAISERV